MKHPSPPKVSLGGAYATRLAILTAHHVPSCFLHSSVNPCGLAVQLGESVLYTSPWDSISAAIVSVIWHPSFSAKAGTLCAFLVCHQTGPLTSPGSYFPKGTLCWVTIWEDIRQDGG